MPISFNKEGAKDEPPAKAAASIETPVKPQAPAPVPPTPVEKAPVRPVQQQQIPVVPVVQTAIPVVAQPHPQTKTGTNMNQVNNTFGQKSSVGINRAPASEAIRTILETMDKVVMVNKQNEHFEYGYVVLDAKVVGLNISAIVVTAVERNKPAGEKRYVAHHTLLLGATSTAPTSQDMTTNGKSGLRYTRIVIPGDAYDGPMQARVKAAVMQEHPGFVLIDAESSAVPATLNLANESAVRNLVSNATQAAETLLRAIVTNNNYTITKEAVAGIVYRTEIKSSHMPFTALDGEPIRSDLVLEMSATRNARNNDGTVFSYNDAEQRNLISQITGYIDIISTPNSAQPIMGGFGFPQQMSAEHLRFVTPRFIATNLDTPDQEGGLAVTLQALGTLQLLQNNQLWKSALIKQYKDGMQNPVGGMFLHDLSVLGLEAPLTTPPLGMVATEQPRPTRWPLSTQVVNEVMVRSLIDTYFHDNIMFSLDVAVSGTSTWQTSVFVAAARGDVTAKQEIFSAADELCNGLFLPMYRQACGGVEQDPFFNDNLYIDLGHYYTDRGMRDRRDVDYLAVSNYYSDKELDTINDWSNLQANAEIDPMFRLSEARNIASAIFADSVITGRAVRITANPVFMHTLAAAQAAAGLSYAADIGIAQPQSTKRMVMSYMNNVPRNLGNAGSFTQGGTTRQDATGNAGSFGRYSTFQAQQAAPAQGNTSF